MQDRPWLNKYDAGVPHSINYPSSSVPDMLAEFRPKIPRETMHDLQRSIDILPPNG